MHRVAQEFIAPPADHHSVHLSGLERNRSRSSQALQHIVGAIPLGASLPMAASNRGPSTFLAPGRPPKRSLSGCLSNSSSIWLRYSASCLSKVLSNLHRLTANWLLARVTGLEALNLSALAKISNRVWAVSGRQSRWLCRNFSHLRLPAVTSASGVGKPST